MQICLKLCLVVRKTLLSSFYFDIFYKHYCAEHTRKYIIYKHIATDVLLKLKILDLFHFKFR